jgi:DNA-directed RNA polymerase subunit M/transcription elongation factor TFIIS
MCQHFSNSPVDLVLPEEPDCNHCGTPMKLRKVLRGGLVKWACDYCPHRRNLSYSDFHRIEAKLSTSDFRMTNTILRKNYAFKCSECGQHVVLANVIPSLV